MINNYPQSYSEDMEYSPRPRGIIFRTISFLAKCSIIFIYFSGTAILGYDAGTNYALSLWPDPIEIKHIDSTAQPKSRIVTTGVASWYDYRLDGIEWSKNHATCASRTLDRYSMARVTNVATGASVDCYVNDYIEHPDREIDLSSHAFSKLAPLSAGLINVTIEQL